MGAGARTAESAPIEHVVAWAGRKAARQGIAYEAALRRFERGYVLGILRRCGGNMGDAAEALGVHRNTMTRMAGRLGIVKKEVMREVKA